MAHALTVTSNSRMLVRAMWDDVAADSAEQSLVSSGIDPTPATVATFDALLAAHQVELIAIGAPTVEERCRLADAALRAT